MTQAPLLGMGPITPPGPPAVPSVSSLEAAAAAAAKINAVLAAKGKLQMSKSKDNDKSRSSQNELVVAEIEINDVPVYCRNMLTKRTMQDTISRETGAAVSTRGRYMSEEDKLSNTSGDRSLYLFVQALTKDKVDLAVNRIIDIIRNVSHGAAPTPKVSYKNLSDNSATSNTKPLLGAAPGLPAVGNVFQEKVFVGLEHVHPTFNVKDKIQGPGGSFLSHIRVETGASVYLRGKGSGLMERASGRESFENLYIFLTHQKQENLQAAKKLCENLVQTIQAEYSKYQAQLMAGPPSQVAVSSVGPPQALPTSLYNVPPSMGVRSMFPPASQAAVVTVAAQTTPLVSTGVPSGHPASSQAGQPVSLHHISHSPANSGVVVSVNNAVAYPHLQRFQVPAQQPTLLTSPVPVGLPGGVPQRLALLIQPSGGLQQSHLPSGMVVTPRLSAVVHQPGVIPQGIPIGVRSPLTLLQQRPSLVTEGMPPRLPPGVIAAQNPGQEIRLATHLQAQGFPQHSATGPPQENVVLQAGQIPGMHLQPPPTLVEQVGQQQLPVVSSSQQPPQMLHGPPLQQADTGLENPHVQQEMQPGQSLPETMHPPQMATSVQQQIHQHMQMHAPVQQEAPGGQQVVHQQSVPQQITVQHSAAQVSSPQHIILQQTPGLQSIQQSIAQSIQQPLEIQHHQIVQGLPPPLFQNPPVQLPPHSSHLLTPATSSLPAITASRGYTESTVRSRGAVNLG
ncbi:hypothetical protein BSL78_22005 [Apostichopus japonicus]|uniref:KH homology domain-containing protein 4 n=1 Tax=Stichopus japonicus TaxID=307972 RepID=A0A2G8JZE7_STIJA|nr:hypothetical protein BSL78_22005 [Apostichopus japonicus]